MNAERLLEVYEQISEAPDAIARLRRFVLDLAVRGKLVEQDAGDEPAKKLIADIRRTKEDLIKEGKIKKPKSLELLAETPFDVPASWAWEKLGKVTSYIQRGKSPKYSPGSRIPVVSQKCVQWSGLDMTVAKDISRESFQKYEAIRLLLDGDLLWNSTGTGTIGRVLVLQNPPENLVCDSHVTVVRPIHLNSNYVSLWLRSDHVYGQIEGSAAGSTNQIELTATLANNQPVPIPPLPEQHRIVAKVDELMALCDRLEEAHKTREEVRDKLTAASQARLTAPDTTAEDFRAHAAFALKELPALTTRPDQIKTLRQTILNLAVRGKLVEQDPADEPAHETLKRLLKARQELEEQGRILKIKKIPALNEPVFEAPHGWEWCPLVTICDVVDPNPSHRMPRYVSSGGQPFISSQNFVDDDGVDYSIGKRVDMTTVEEQISRFSILEGAFGFSRIGTIGKTRPLARERSYGISHAVCVVNPVSVEDLSMRFLRLAMSAEIILEHAHHGTRSVGVPDLGMGVIRSMSIPLPPVAEQHRIVARVDALMALCDQLEAALTTADTTRTRLLEAFLHEALGPTREVLEAAE